ncbi:MAG: hypothetical protein JSU63_15925 [Phycisphaerales bacterium]|nr:MAG: hypothetical protein JSU63_15925 [Phycisphaerales bacterium]
MMATNVRGRTGTRSTNRDYGHSSWGTTSRKTNTGNRKRTTSNWSGPPRYRGVWYDFNTKISSYRTLVNQTKGTARYTRPTPQMLNTFANWVNKGAVIQTCTPQQVAKWARNYNVNFNTRNPTTTSCKNVLHKYFGKSVIKAVARTKTGSFMVATSPTWKGKNFNFPK